MMANFSIFNHYFLIIVAALIFAPLFSVSETQAQIQMCPLAIVKSASPSDDTEFDFELGQPDRPGLLKSGTNFLYVLMPINLG